MKLAYIAYFLLNVEVLAFRPHMYASPHTALRTSTRRLCVDRDVRAIPQSGVTERSDYDNMWRTTVDSDIVPVKKEKFTIRPEVITFDAFGTLIEPSQSIGRWYREVLNSLTEMTIRLPHPKYFGFAFEKVYKEKCKEEPCFGSTTGKSARQWWTEVIEATYRNTEGLVYVEPEEISALLPQMVDFLYDDVFSTKEGWQVKEDVFYTLEKLRDWRDQGSGPKIGIVSNFDERLPVILSELGISEYLDFVTTSYSAKVEKPDKGIFEEALKTAGVSNAQAAYHIGDHMGNDVEGAVRAGWQGLRYNPWFDEEFPDWKAIDTEGSAKEGQLHRQDLMNWGRKNTATGLEWVELWGLDDLLWMFGFPDDDNKLLRTTFMRGTEDAYV